MAVLLVQVVMQEVCIGDEEDQDVVNTNFLQNVGYISTCISCSALITGIVQVSDMPQIQQELYHFYERRGSIADIV